MFWFCDSNACGILGPQPEIELTSSVLEGEVLAIGPQDKSQLFILELKTLYRPSLNIASFFFNLISNQSIHSTNCNTSWMDVLEEKMSPLLLPDEGT